MAQDQAFQHHQVIVVGGGTAGTTVAASLLRKRPDLEVAVVEPSEVHYYQPALTLVGGGTYPLGETVRPQVCTLPEKATWIQKAAAEFRPDEQHLVLDDGQILKYDYLVVCPGIQLNWDQIEGLTETLGKNGVCSNYSPAYASYTWKCIDNFPGGRALFTQPPAPFKCAGAPQKIAYLAAHQAKKRSISETSDIQFHTAAPSLFSVPAFVPPLEEVARDYGVGVHYSSNLVSVDGRRRIARFEVTDSGGEKSIVEERFDLLHVTPPQSAPDFIRSSPLANEAGWVDVDKNSLRHARYPNIFSLGDASSLPTSKTAAAIRKQAPVVVRNILAQIDGQPLRGYYDGYTSCPVVTGYGRVMLAEFIYDGVVTPTLPLNPFRESRFYWYVKKYMLPKFYWDAMLQGSEHDIAHKRRSFGR